MRSAVLAALASFAAYPAFAQSTAPADTTRQLGEVTVYASRLDQVAGQTGRYVTVVPGASLAQYPVNSLDDLLRLLPALEVQSRGSFGAQADITLRGSTFNQVLLLLDGMRLNDPLTGHFAGYLPIAPSEIEQIEIVRGPGAALYGPDAVGGFINIVTKTFAATQRPDVAEAQASFMAGEWNLKSTNVGFYARQKGLRLAGGVLNNSTDGQQRPAPSTLRSDLAATTYSVSAAAQITDKLSAAARASFDQRDFNAQYFYTNNAADQARETTSRDWYQGQLRYDWSGRSRTELQVVGSASKDLFRFTPASVASDHLMHYTNVQLQHQYFLSDKLRTSLGGQADQRRIASNDRGNHNTWHVGAFAVVAAAPLNGLSLTAALRLDHDRAYGTELVPQLNASQRLLADKLTVRGAIGKAIRAADFTERYTSNSRPGIVPNGFNVGNAKLEAERTMNYELGADYQPLSFLTVRATYFRRSGSNLIDYVARPGREVIEATGLSNLNPTATYRFAQNLFSVTTQGLETEVGVRKQLGTGMLDATLGYTRLSVDNSDGVVSQYLANSARQLLAGTVGFTHPRFGLTVGGLYKQRDAQAAAALSRELTASYAVVNARAELALLPGRLWATAQVQNLFDAEYADLLGAQMPRRWLMGGVRVLLRK
ncbi:TonB-dependent receptor plug domain-containing protein [Hymenobacter saemangeumensis]|uniref:TonB-dependent receptor plug domain-containing protein n=1 Tax=Hymenobacter saemangeumensis TaxID=1084522 RepID=A0ABP8IG06_9BACT